MIAYLLWIITTIVAAASSSASISDEIVTITSGVYGHWTYETYNDCKKVSYSSSTCAQLLFLFFLCICVLCYVVDNHSNYLIIAVHCYSFRVGEHLEQVFIFRWRYRYPIQ